MFFLIFAGFMLAMAAVMGATGNPFEFWAVVGAISLGLAIIFTKSPPTNVD